MAAALRVALLVVAAAAVLADEDTSIAAPYCVTKDWGVTTGRPVPIIPTTLPRNVYNYNVMISNPCAPGGRKVGVQVLVCDWDAPPRLTVLTTDIVIVHRPNPIHDAILTGSVFCSM